jgi:hypothetical protein
MITRNEMEEWFRDPVTQRFLEGLALKREEVKESWAKQVYFDEADPRRSDRLNLYALASIDVLGQVIELVEENRPQTREVD